LSAHVLDLLPPLGRVQRMHLMNWQHLTIPYYQMVFMWPFLLPFSSPYKAQQTHLVGCTWHNHCSKSTCSLFKIDVLIVQNPQARFYISTCLFVQIMKTINYGMCPLQTIVPNSLPIPKCCLTLLRLQQYIILPDARWIWNKTPSSHLPRCKLWKFSVKKNGPWLYEKKKSECAPDTHVILISFHHITMYSYLPSTFKHFWTPSNARVCNPQQPIRLIINASILNEVPYPKVSLVIK
jgi:hypothetical protein